MYTTTNCSYKCTHNYTLLSQLKNMIAALYASRSIGWRAIEDMPKREVERMKNNELVRVPGLKENYVYRDSWTRLNVKPAKIMQVFIHMNMHSTCDMENIHVIYIHEASILLARAYRSLQYSTSRKRTYYRTCIYMYSVHTLYM